VPLTDGIEARIGSASWCGSRPARSSAPRPSMAALSNSRRSPARAARPAGTHRRDQAARRAGRSARPDARADRARGPRPQARALGRPSRNPPPCARLCEPATLADAVRCSEAKCQPLLITCLSSRAGTQTSCSGLRWSQGRCREPARVPRRVRPGAGRRRST
jgi:hypothetical protein